MIRRLQKWLALAWCGVLLLVITWLSARLGDYTFDSSLLQLLPVEQQATLPAQHIALANGHLTRLVDRELLLLVGAPTAAQSLSLAASLQQRLASRERQPVQTSAADLRHLADAYFPYRYFLLAAADQQRLSVDAEALLSLAQRQLYSPMAAGYKPIDDPFWLFQRYLQSLADASVIHWQDGWPTLQAQGRVYRLLRFQVQGDAFSVQTQAGLADELDLIQSELPAGVQLFSAGLVVHAAYGARTARQEISTVGVGSLVGVLLLLWFSLGRNAVLALLTCVGSGILVALAVSVWWFDSLHLITLAFGASLIGVGIDYGIHTRVALAAGATLRQVLPALLLGLLTSLLAYGIQGVMPFPGLQQMALFSCVGLLAAWLSACLWLPLVAGRPAGERPLFRGAQRYWRKAPAVALTPARTTLLLAIGLGALWQLPGDDRLSSLQTSPDALVAQEQTFRELLKQPGVGQYFLVHAGSEAQLDQQLASLTQRLTALRATQAISGFQSLHDWRPPLAEQRRNYQRQTDFYREHAPSWYAQLGATELLDQSRRAMSVASEPLTLAAWRDALLQPQLFFARGEAQLFAIVPVSGISDAQLLTALNSEAVHYVDRPAMMAGILSHYRWQLQHWMVAAIVLVLSLLVWRLGWRALPLLALPVLVVVLVAVCLSANQSLTLFHCLALLLVLGIGFDSCIFFAAGNHPQHVWRATSLSVATSMISFGLLALSSTPVLHFFGVTVLLGLGFIWCLIPVIYKGLQWPPQGAEGEVGKA